MIYPNSSGGISYSSGWPITTSGTSFPVWTTGAIDVTSFGSVQREYLSPVLESPAVELGDRDWLDAQVEEVCALAR